MKDLIVMQVYRFNTEVLLGEDSDSKSEEYGSNPYRRAYRNVV